MIRAVIFDWSGVLSDDWVATFKTSNDVFETYGYPRLSMEKFRETYELPWTNFYKKLGYEIDAAKEYELWRKLFPKYYYLLKPFPEAKEVLKQLGQREIKSIVLSSHEQKLLMHEIGQYGFNRLINGVEASVLDKREKIEELLTRHEIEREKTIYVGDMCHDIETARLAGIRSVAVLSGYDSRERLEREKPDYVIESVAGLPALIEKMEGSGSD